MCSKGKCLHCIPAVENACLVIAILSAVGTGLTVLASILMGILTASGLIFDHSTPSYKHSYERDLHEAFVGVAELAVGVVIVIVGVTSLIGFIFSVLLCNGICNRRPGHVKAYFIYGVVATVLLVILAVFEMSVDDNKAPGIAGLFACVLYSLFLILVHQTHVKLSSGTAFKKHIELVEDTVY